MSPNKRLPQGGVAEVLRDPVLADEGAAKALAD